MMKKWLIFLFIIFIVSIWQSVDIYQKAVYPKKSMEEHAISVAKDQGNVAQVDNVYTYYGNNDYTVVSGIDKWKNHLFVWVPLKKGDVVVRNASEGISKNTAINILKRDQNPKKILKATLGMENDIPIWEITYMDQSNRYSYYYLDFETGQFIKRYSL